MRRGTGCYTLRVVSDLPSLGSSLLLLLLLKPLSSFLFLILFQMEGFRCLVVLQATLVIISSSRVVEIVEL